MVLGSSRVGLRHHLYHFFYDEIICMIVLEMSFMILFTSDFVTYVVLFAQDTAG